MARNKRENKRSMGVNPQRQAMSIEEYMGQTLGDWDSIRSPHKYMNAVPISIFDIVPDEAQPRRAIPQAVLENWEHTGNLLHDMPLLFEIWETLVNAQRSNDEPLFLLENYLGQDVVEERGNEAHEYDPEINPIERALVKIADIALSIRKYGLNNPITVAPLVPAGYVIETGERRWLAYHLLHAKGLKTQQEGIDDDFSTISARKVDHVSVWRQAAENGARDDLNAIGKARQIAVLTMDLHQTFNQAIFLPFEEFEHDRHFYAQIYSNENGSFLRAIRGTQDHIIAAVGLKSGRQVSQYRKLLTLPDEAWTLADDHNLSEYALRQIVDDNSTTDDEKIDMVHEIIQGNYVEHTSRKKSQPTNGTTVQVQLENQESAGNSTTVPINANNPVEDSDTYYPPDLDAESQPTIPTPKFFSNAARTFNRIQAGDSKNNEAAWYYLTTLRHYLEDVEKRLREVEQDI